MISPASAGNMMGQVNLGLGMNWEEYSDGDGYENDIDFSSFHGSASVNIPYNDIVNLQLDVLGAASADNVDGSKGNRGDSYFGGSGIGAHLNYRDQQGALGVFASVGRANEGSGSSDDYAVFAAGLEGQYFCNAWTLLAQVGYLDTDDDSDMIQEAGYIDVGAIHYPSSRLKLSATVGYLNGTAPTSSTTSSFADVEQWHWTVGVEYLFGKSIPVSTYLEYRGLNTETHDTNTPGANEIDAHTLNVGVRSYFGSDGDLTSSLGRARM
jgi:long-subunit fatty acid transport protein